MQDLVGELLGGCQIEKKLGQGGMGAVYKGTQLSLGREVALKVIAESYMSNDQAVARFEREARSVAVLNHANIVQVYDMGRSEGGQYYIMMEFVDGKSLSDIMKERGAIPENEGLQIIRQACKGLQAAVEKQIIHRDIKPDNLMITTKGVVKVADFGLAKDVGSASQLTATGHVMGTPAYIAPEQGDGRPSDHRSDIYSLGATFYAMITGQMPYTGESPIAIVMQHISAPVPDPRDVKSDISEGTAKIIMKMMGKAPEERYQSQDEVIHDIDVVLGVAKDGERLIADGGSMAFDEQMTLMGPVDGVDLGKAETIMEVSSPTPHTIDANMMSQTTGQIPQGRMGLYVGILVAVLLLVGGGIAAAIIFSSNKGGDGKKDGDNGSRSSTENPGEKNGTKGGEDNPDEPGTKGGGEDVVHEPGTKEPGTDPAPPPVQGPKIDVTILMPATGTYHRRTRLTVKGRCGVGAKSLKINDEPAALGPDGSFMEKVTLPEGTSEIKVTAEGDKKAFGETMVAVTVDTRQPVLSVASVEKGKTLRVNQTPFNVRGTVTDLSPVNLTVNGRSVNLDGENFEADVELDDGLNRIQIFAEDQAKNTTSESVKVIYDPTPPTLLLDTPFPEKIVQSDPHVEISGTVSEEIQGLTFQEDPVSLEGRSFTVPVTLSPGANDFELTALDLAGNEATLKISTEYLPIPSGLVPGETPGSFLCEKDGAVMMEVPLEKVVIGRDGGAPEEGPPHEVELSAFYIDKTEVTNAQYRKFLEAIAAAEDSSIYAHPSQPEGKDHTPEFWDDPDFNSPDQPVVGIDWFDAYAYATWAGKSLPTEAQWEAAAMAGFESEKPEFPWGLEEPSGRANFDDVEGFPRPVGSYPDGVNKLGLCDMAGNVQEWCLDWYDPNFYGSAEAVSPNPVNATPSKHRVMRGGHFLSAAERLRLTTRAHFFPTGRYETVGFRCVLNTGK